MALDTRIGQVLRDLRMRPIQDPQAVLEANPARLCRAMTQWARQSPETVPDHQHARGYIGAVLEAADGIPDADKARAFISYFKNKPVTMSKTGSGRTALLWEVWLSQRQGGMYKQLLETNVQGTSGFLAIFIGPIDQLAYRTMTEEGARIGNYKMLLEAGQKSSTNHVSDYTIIEVSNPDPEAAASLVDLYVYAAMANSPAKMMQARREYGFNESVSINDELFRTLAPNVPVLGDGELRPFKDDHGITWWGSAGQWGTDRDMAETRLNERTGKPHKETSRTFSQRGPRGPFTKARIRKNRRRKMFREAIDGASMREASRGKNVPHAKNVSGLEDLERHYKQYQPSSIRKGSTNDKMFIVRLPKQNRIHFYRDNTKIKGPAVLFGSEGYYDEESKWWNESDDTLSSVESLTEAPDPAAILAKFIRNEMTDRYAAEVGRPTSLYKKRGDYDGGKAYLLARHLVTAGGQTYHAKFNKGAEGPWHSIFTPEVRERTMKLLAQMAAKDHQQDKFDAMLPAKYQKGFKGYDKDKTDESVTDRVRPESLQPGHTVEAHWSAGSAGTYRARAEVIRASDKTARVKITEAVPSNTGGRGYPKGHTMTLPFTQDHKDFTTTNGLFAGFNTQAHNPREIVSRWGTYYVQEQQDHTEVLLDTGVYVIDETFNNIRDMLANINEDITGPAEQDMVTEQVLHELTQDHGTAIKTFRCVNDTLEHTIGTTDPRFKPQDSLRAERDAVVQTNINEQIKQLAESGNDDAHQYLIAEASRAGVYKFGRDVRHPRFNTTLKDMMKNNVTTSVGGLIEDTVRRQVKHDAQQREEQVREVLRTANDVTLRRMGVAVYEDQHCTSGVRYFGQTRDTYLPFLIRGVDETGDVELKVFTDVRDELDEVIAKSWVDRGTAMRAIEDITWGTPLTKKQAWMAVRKKYKSVTQKEFSAAWEDMKVSGMARSGIVRRGGDRYEYQDVSKYESDSDMDLTEQPTTKTSGVVVKQLTNIPLLAKKFADKLIQDGTEAVAYMIQAKTSVLEALKRHTDKLNKRFPDEPEMAILGPSGLILVTGEWDESAVRATVLAAARSLVTDEHLDTLSTREAVQDAIHEAGGYNIKAADKRVIKDFVSGKATTKPGSNLEIEGDTLKQTSMGSKVIATRDKQGFVTPGQAVGNVSQTWVNAVKRAARQAGSLRESGLGESNVDEWIPAIARMARIGKGWKTTDVKRVGDKVVAKFKGGDQAKQFKAWVDRSHTAASTKLDAPARSAIQTVTVWFDRKDESTSPFTEAAKTAAQSFSDLIKAASKNAVELRKLEKRLENHQKLGTIKTHEFKKLDMMIFDRLVKLEPDGPGKNESTGPFTTVAEARNKTLSGNYKIIADKTRAYTSLLKSEKLLGKLEVPGRARIKTAKDIGKDNAITLILSGVNDLGYLYFARKLKNGKPSKQAKDQYIGSTVGPYGRLEDLVKTGKLSPVKLAKVQAAIENRIKQGQPDDPFTKNESTGPFTTSIHEAKQLDAPPALKGKAPGTYTKADQKKAVAYFAQMSLKELRKRQDLVKAQQKMAYKMGTTAIDPVQRSKADTAMVNLNMMDNVLMAAVDRREFGESTGPFTTLVQEASVYEKLGYAVLDVLAKSRKTMTVTDVFVQAKKYDIGNADVSDLKSVLSMLNSNKSIVWDTKNRTITPGLKFKAVLAKAKKQVDEAVSPEQKETSKRIKAFAKRQGWKVSVTGSSGKASYVQARMTGGKAVSIYSGVGREVFPKEFRKIAAKVAGAKNGETNYGNVSEFIIAMMPSQWDSVMAEAGTKKFPAEVKESVDEVDTFDYEAEGRKAVKGIAGKVRYSSAARAVMVKLNKPAGKITTVMVMPSSTGQHDINYRSADNRQWPKLRQQGIRTKYVKDAIEQTLERQVNESFSDPAIPQPQADTPPNGSLRKGKTRSGRPRAIFTESAVPRELRDSLKFLANETQLVSNHIGTVVLIETQMPARTKALLRAQGWGQVDSHWAHRDHLFVIHEAPTNDLNIWGMVEAQAGLIDDLFLTARQSVLDAKQVVETLKSNNAPVETYTAANAKLRATTRDLIATALFARHPDAKPYREIGETKTKPVTAMAESQRETNVTNLDEGLSVRQSLDEGKKMTAKQKDAYEALLRTEKAFARDAKQYPQNKNLKLGLKQVRVDIAKMRKQFGITETAVVDEPLTGGRTVHRVPDVTVLAHLDINDNVTGAEVAGPDGTHARIDPSIVARAAIAASRSVPKN